MIKTNDRYTTGEDALSSKEWDKLISVVDNLEDEVMLKMTVTKGFRREDIGHGTIKRKRKNKTVHITTGIKIENIHMDQDDKKLLYYESKKDRYREVPLNDTDITLIKKLINSRGKHQHEYLITYSGRTAYRKLQEYCDKAGIRRRPFHALRATCIKFCKSAGWSDEQVARLTGDTISVIQEHYATPSTSEMAEVAESKPII